MWPRARTTRGFRRWKNEKSAAWDEESKLGKSREKIEGEKDEVEAEFAFR